MSTSSCTSQLDTELLADYWFAALSPSDEETVEEHLLGLGVHIGAGLAQDVAGLGAHDLHADGLEHLEGADPAERRARRADAPNSLRHRQLSR